MSEPIGIMITDTAGGGSDEVKVDTAAMRFEVTGFRSGGSGGRHMQISLTPDGARRLAEGILASLADAAA